MAGKFTRNILIILSLVFVYDCRQRVKGPIHRTLTKHVSWEFYLQPFRNARIYIGDRLTHSKLIDSDKSFGLLEIKAPLYEDQLGFQLKIERRGFQVFTREVFLQKQDHIWLSKKPIFVLDQKKSRHRFHSYHRVGRQPKSVTFLSQNKVAIPLLGDAGIDILNIETGRKKRIAPPKKYSHLAGFVESLVLKGQEELWVSQMSADAVHIFDLESLKYKNTIRLSGKWVKIITYDPKRKLVYASNWVTKNISVIDPARHRELNTIPASGVPRGMWVDSDSGDIYVAQFGQENDTDEKGRLLRINPDSGKILARTGHKGSKRHLIYSNFAKKLYLSDMRNSFVEVHDILKGLVTTSIKVYHKPNTIALDPSHRYLYVSCRGPNSPDGYLNKGNSMGRISMIDLKEHKVIETWEGGNQPTGLDISPDGKYVAFSDFLDHAVRVYERL